MITSRAVAATSSKSDVADPTIKRVTGMAHTTGTYWE